MNRRATDRSWHSATALMAVILALTFGCGTEEPATPGKVTGDTTTPGATTATERTDDTASKESREAPIAKGKTQRAAAARDKPQKGKPGRDSRERGAARDKAQSGGPQRKVSRPSVTNGGLKVTLLEAFVARGPGGKDARGSGDAPEPKGSADYVLGSFEVENVSGAPVQFEGMLEFRLYARGAQPGRKPSREGEQRPTPLEGQLHPDTLPQRYEILPMDKTLAPGESLRGGMAWAVVAGPEARISLAYEPEWPSTELSEPRWKLGSLKDLPRKRLPPQR